MLNDVNVTTFITRIFLCSLMLASVSGCSSMIVLELPSASQRTAEPKTGVVAVDNLIVKGDQQRRNGLLSEASATLERALRLAPRSPSVYVALARVKLDANLYGTAKQFAQKAMTLLPAQGGWKEDRIRSEAKWVIEEAQQRQ